MYGVSWGKGALKGLGNSTCGGKRIILQGTCGDEISDVPIEFELLHFSCFPHRDHFQMTTRPHAAVLPTQTRECIHLGLQLNPTVVRGLLFLKCKHSIKTEFFALL